MTMQQPGTDDSTNAAKDLRAALEFRARVDAQRGRLIQMSRDVEKPLGEVGDLRSAAAHLRHLALVARTASLLDEVVLFVEFQGARRILHVPVAARVKAHLRDIGAHASGDDALALALARLYLGFVSQVARVAQSQRPGRLAAGKDKEARPKGPAGDKPRREGRPEGRPDGRGPDGRPAEGRPAADGAPGGPPREGRGRRNRPLRGPRPEGHGPRPEGHGSDPAAEGTAPQGTTPQESAPTEAASPESATRAQDQAAPAADTTNHSPANPGVETVAAVPPPPSEGSESA